jgi:hypothetical protein
MRIILFLVIKMPTPTKETKIDFKMKLNLENFIFFRSISALFQVF